MLKREALERHQVWVYLIAIIIGLALGNAAPALAPTLEALLWPALAVLLYATFTQVPFAQLPVAFKDARFVSAALIGNFVVLPVLVWSILLLVPDDPAICAAPSPSRRPCWSRRWRFCPSISGCSWERSSWRSCRPGV